MEAKNQTAAAMATPRNDQESNTSYQSQRRNKRVRCMAYIAIFAVLQTAIIVVLALVIGRVRTPNVRLGDVALTDIGGGSMRLAAQVFIRNRNFGPYRFGNSVATVRSGGGATLGQFVIRGAQVETRATSWTYVISNLSFSNASSGGDLPVTVDATLRGRVRVARLVRRRRSARMSCAMTINLSTNVVQNLRCN